MWSPGQLNPSGFNGQLFRCTNNQDAIDDVHWCRNDVYTNGTGFNLTNYLYCNGVSIIYTSSEKLFRGMFCYASMF